MKYIICYLFDPSNKNKNELDYINIITKKTGNAIKHIMKNIHLFDNEKDIENELHKFMNYSNTSFELICASGRNNSIIHYTKNNSKLNGLILLDIGFKYNGYCSDVARTFPLNKKFNNLETILYNMIYNLSEYAIANIKNTFTLEQLEHIFRKKYLSYLLKLNFIYTNDIKLTYLFMPHNIGHNIGTNVHDTPLSCFKNNIVFTIEPGIYFQNNLLNNNNININEVKKFWHIGGIRIEDTISIYDDNIHVLSNNIPKSIHDIETFMS